MGPVERLEAILKESGKKRNDSQPRYKRDGSFSHWAHHLIMVPCAEIVEACALVRDRTDKVNDLELGSKRAIQEERPDITAAIQVDDLYHLIDKAKGE